MRTKPLVPIRDRAQKLAGDPVGYAITCQLGHLTKDRGECRDTAVETIADIRICAKHLKIIAEIVADSDPQFVARHPVSSGYLRMVS